ncbi:hypothetical protein [Janthinobacterium sp. UMAB-56]|uniref:hypothetical protein n=1 Tax=Janthinobacterium sp. UMAB-56 TaxID=1365361 RepID=UPI001C5A2AEE|nr:hypothetical protein [Janthinobacterium sp. UMAB-56]
MTHQESVEKGFEIGHFRLKPGTTESALMAACKQMEVKHLQQQEGFISHQLVRLDDGLYLDLVVALSRSAAERICGSWIGQPECEAFLALIEAESIQFGTML